MAVIQIYYHNMFMPVFIFNKPVNSDGFLKKRPLAIHHHTQIHKNTSKKKNLNNTTKITQFKDLSMPIIMTLAKPWSLSKFYSIYSSLDGGSVGVDVLFYVSPIVCGGSILKDFENASSRLNPFFYKP